MKIEKKPAYTIVYAEEGKLLIKEGMEEGSAMLILGKEDSQDNYVEIDIPKPPPDPIEVDIDGLKEALITQTRSELGGRLLDMLQPHIEAYAGQLAEEQRKIEEEILSALTEEELNDIRERP